jgi:hypothetical protein
MMNAFISYSISENEQYILTLLAQKLQEKGISLTTSYSQLYFLDWQNINEIINAHFFIGLIAHPGNQSDRVYRQLRQALQHRKPAILLIEDTLAAPSDLAYFPNVVRFNRNHPWVAIDEVKNRMKTSQTPEITQPNNDALAWVLGGLATLALIALLSSDKGK